MLLDIKETTPFTSRFSSITYRNYTLIDSKFEKKITFQCKADGDRSVEIANFILNSVYEEYRERGQCPFFNLKALYDNKGFYYQKFVYRQTDFFQKHIKVMEKILIPDIEFGYSFDRNRTSTTLTYNPYVGTATSNSITYNIDTSYPVSYNIRIR